MWGEVSGETDGVGGVRDGSERLWPEVIHFRHEAKRSLIQLYSYRYKDTLWAIRALQCLDSSFVSRTLSISWSLNDGDFRRNIGVFQKISGIKVEETKEPLTPWTKDTRKQDNLFKNIQVYQHNQGVCQQGQFFYWSEAVRAIYGKYIVLTNESLS